MASPARTAPPWLLATGGVLGEAAAAVTRSEPGLTRETARQSAATVRYDGSRAERELGVSYQPFSETARRIAAARAT